MLPTNINAVLGFLSHYFVMHLTCQDLIAKLLGFFGRHPEDPALRAGVKEKCISLLKSP